MDIASPAEMANLWPCGLLGEQWGVTSGYKHGPPEVGIYSP